MATLWHWKFRPARQSAWAVLSIALAIGLFISYLHSLGQQDSRERLAKWESTLREIAANGELGTAPWNPIACRGNVDSSLRFRKATIPGGNTDLGEVGWQTLTVMRVFEIRIGGQWSPASLLMPLTIDGKLSGYYPGDAIELYGQWRLPSKPSNPGQFNQSRRYAEQGYAAQARADSESQLTRIDGTSRIRVDRYLAMVSAKALWAIERYVILGQSELTAALVLGQREQAEWRLQEELLATGTIHMLSISGMHIEMVALILWMIGLASWCNAPIWSGPPKWEQLTRISTWRAGGCCDFLNALLADLPKGVRLSSTSTNRKPSLLLLLANPRLDSRSLSDLSKNQR